MKRKTTQAKDRKAALNGGLTTIPAPPPPVIKNWKPPVIQTVESVTSEQHPHLYENVVTAPVAPVPSPETSDSEDHSNSLEDWARFEHPQKLFSLRLPRGWKETQPLSADAAFAAASPDRVVLFEVLCVDASNERNGLALIAALPDIMIEALRADHPDVREVWRGSGGTGFGDVCQRLIIEHIEEVNKSMGQGSTLFTTDHFFLGNEELAVFANFKTLTFEYRGRARLFEQIVRSISLPKKENYSPVSTTNLHLEDRVDATRGHTTDISDCCSGEDSRPEAANVPATIPAVEELATIAAPPPPPIENWVQPVREETALICDHTQNRKEEKRSTDNRISRYWPATITALLAATGLIVAAIALWNSEHEIWAAIVGLFALSATVHAIVWRKAKCPLCGSSMTFPGGMRRCGGCGQYLHTEGGRIVPVSPGTVAPKPFFEVKIAPLLSAGKMPADWKWPRPSGCCVCGGMATRNYPVDLTNLDEQFSAIKTTRVRISVPHCDKHDAGVAYEDAPGTLRFSSFDCWREFCLLNRA